MSKEAHEAILNDLKDRQSWEDRQKVWFEMRHEGLRRKNKPFPGAADLHFPLADSQIDKLKPFYFAQIWGSELLAAFLSKRAQALEATQCAAGWFHYQVVQNTNWFDESLAAIDNMLMSGVAPLKLWWDERVQALCFDAIDPVFFVVPRTTQDLQTADRLCHVLQLTPSAYKLRDDYNQDEALLKKITGKGGNSDPAKMQAKYSREGITCGQGDDQIVLWESWERTASGWRVETFSPLAPGEPIKAPYLCPYQMGGKPIAPFVGFRREVKDKGYYAPRGVPERVAPFEAQANRLSNEKADAMTFLNRPVFTVDGQSTNLQNVRLTPGQIVPNNLRAVQMPTVPIDFDREMINVRMTAEYLESMPDFGIGQQINTRERRTATEVNAASSLMNVSVDMKGQIFRQTLSGLYRMAWSILRTYLSHDLAYHMADEMQMLPSEALHDDYLIQPDGSPDAWNKPARMQRAVARYQMLRGDPFTNQAELTKTVLEADDPRLVRRLYQDPQAKAADQQEDQAMELAILEKGYPARVLPADDDQVHIQIALGRLQQNGQMVQLGAEHPIPPIGLQRIQEHVAAHLQQLRQRNPQMARQAQAAVAQFFPPQQQQAQPAMPADAGATALAAGGGAG